MFYQKLFIFALLVMPLSCGDRTEFSVHHLKWLIGTWANTSAGQTVYESWSQVNDRELAGKSYSVKDNDTVVFETIRVISENGRLFYRPKVKGQNGDTEVNFRLKLLIKDEMVFENKAHDFPQRISYRRITADSLVAEVSGNQDGRERIETFSMKRQ